jgi:hypothetical protein
MLRHSTDGCVALQELMAFGYGGGERKVCLTGALKRESERERDCPYALKN